MCYHVFFTPSQKPWFPDHMLCNMSSILIPIIFADICFLLLNFHPCMIFFILPHSSAMFLSERFNLWCLKIIYSLHFSVQKKTKKHGQMKRKKWWHFINFVQFWCKLQTVAQYHKRIIQLVKSGTEACNLLYQTWGKNSTAVLLSRANQKVHIWTVRFNRIYESVADVPES